MLLIFLFSSWYSCYSDIGYNSLVLSFLYIFFQYSFYSILCMISLTLSPPQPPFLSWVSFHVLFACSLDLKKIFFMAVTSLLKILVISSLGNFLLLQWFFTQYAFALLFVLDIILETSLKYSVTRVCLLTQEKLKTWLNALCTLKAGWQVSIGILLGQKRSLQKTKNCLFPIVYSCISLRILLQYQYLQVSFLVLFRLSRKDSSAGNI